MNSLLVESPLNQKFLQNQDEKENDNLLLKDKLLSSSSVQWKSNDIG